METESCTLGGMPGFAERSRARIRRMADTMAGCRRSAAVLALLATTCGLTTERTDDHGEACGEGQRACDGTCIDPTIDVENCGECGLACEKGVGCFAGTCTFPAPLSIPRIGLALVSGGDGLIYAIGGAKPDDTGELDTVEVYDIRANRWSEVASLGSARSFLGAAVRDASIFAIGGLRSSGPMHVIEEGQPTVENYDREDDQWSPTADLWQPRADPAVAVAQDGRIFAIWGWDGDIETPLTSMEILDTSGSWTLEDALPKSMALRWGARAVVDEDGKIWLLGGCATQEMNWTQGSHAVDVYDPATRVWSVGEEMQRARCVGAAALGADGHVYSIGGYDEDGVGTSEVEALDPATGTWRPVASLPGPVGDAAAVTGPDGRIYVVGGIPIAGAGTFGFIYVYDPARDEWYF